MIIFRFPIVIYDFQLYLIFYNGSYIVCKNNNFIHQQLNLCYCDSCLCSLFLTCIPIRCIYGKYEKFRLEHKDAYFNKITNSLLSATFFLAINEYRTAEKAFANAERFVSSRYFSNVICRSSFWFISDRWHFG